MSASRRQRSGSGKRDKRAQSRGAKSGSSFKSKSRTTSHATSHTKSHQPQSKAHAQRSAQGRPNPFTVGGRLTLFGRKPVLEALNDPRITSQKLFVARGLRGGLVDEITRRAEQVGLPIERLSSSELSRISKNGRQDQGVALDVQAPRHLSLAEHLRESSSDATTHQPLFLLDGLTTPANVGMVIRSAWASGAAGIILPREGCAPLNPLAVKASAGVAIHAAVLSCQSALEATELLIEHKIPIFGLAGEASRSLYEATWPQRAAWVIGNESEGMSAAVRERLTESVSLPMAGQVESLNAAAAASVVAFELCRQRDQHA